MAGIRGGKSTEEVGEKEKLLSAVNKSLASACENENWGLIVEAAEDYQRTSYKLKHTALPEIKCFSQDEKEVFLKISTTLYQKSQSLHSIASVNDLTSEVQKTVDAKKLHSALESFEKERLSLSELESTLQEILPPSPRHNPSMEAMEKKRTAIDSEDMRLQAFLNMPEEEFANALDQAMETKAGTLLIRRDILPGYSYLNITIEKIALKDPHNYIDPFITVSVKSLVAENIEESQDTPVMNEREPSAITFNTTIQIQRPLEEIPGGSAIFFEFKHYKPKKAITSTKCFSFMEMDEIKPGTTYLEIYKKPTDFRRKKLSLLSAKPLYLHLNLSLIKP